MGDLGTLVQMASEEMDDPEKAQEMAEDMMRGKFNLNHMYYQMSAVGKMGTLEKLMTMLPGMSDMSGQIDFDASQRKLQVFRTIMDSMTAQEKEDPSLIKAKRIERIANGAGVTPHDVRELLKQYNTMKKTMTTFGKDRKMRKQMLKQMSGVDLDSLKELQGSG